MLLVELGLEVTCVILADTEAAKTCRAAMARIAISVFEFLNCVRRARVGGKIRRSAYVAQKGQGGVGRIQGEVKSEG